MFNPNQGPARDVIDRDELERLGPSVIVDRRRTRPLYFDGRFLAARDLTREQNYFLTRQADLGRSGGSGVVHGLMVQRGGTPGSLRIEAGHGVSPAGELIVVPAPLTLELADVTATQRLDASFGLAPLPREPARNRTGLFVVGLRPVEFTANPVASYPTSLQGPRSVEDGDIVEAAAVTLVPYPDEGRGLTSEQRRARVAYEIFVNRGVRDSARSVLPLAMIALNRGVVEWLDPFLVRREVGADHGDVLGLGFAPRALREAHLLQYDHHLRDVLALREAGNRGRHFPASEHFQALPPGGRMPSAAVNPTDFTQIFFPPEMSVGLSIVPEDEVTALLEESLLLPPIDLSLSAEEMASTSVLALIPVPRAEYRTLAARLNGTQRALQPAAPWMVAKRKPFEVLRGLRLPTSLVPTPEPQDVVDEAWRNLLGASDTLWYVRRRNLPYRADVAGELIDMQGVGGQLEGTSSAVLTDVSVRVRSTGGTSPVGVLTPPISPIPAPTPASAETAARPASPQPTPEKPAAEPTREPPPTPSRVPQEATRPAPGDTVVRPKDPTSDLSATLREGLLSAMAQEAEKDPDSAARIEALARDPEFGAGLERLVKEQPELATSETVMTNLVRSGTVEKLDRLARDTGEAELPALATEITKTATSSGTTAPQRLTRLVDKRLQGGGK